MANLKNITDLPVAESADGLNLIVSDNGSAKQIPASSVGAQANWDETDETSPAFIMNKPVVPGVVKYVYSDGYLYRDSYSTNNKLAYSDIINDFESKIIRVNSSDTLFGTLVGYQFNEANYLMISYAASNAVTRLTTGYTKE